MKITEVSNYRGRLERRAVLDDMECVEFRLYSNSRHACRPSAVFVTWLVPITPGARPDHVEARGGRILKSGELGDHETKRYRNSDEWPAWLTEAVEATRPTVEDLTAGEKS